MPNDGSITLGTISSTCTVFEYELRGIICLLIWNSLPPILHKVNPVVESGFLKVYMNTDIL